MSEWNYHDVENAAKLGQELQINNLFFRPDMEPMENRKETPLDILSKNKELLNKSMLYQNEEFKVNIEKDRENDVLKVDDDKLVCFYSNHSIYIAANGDVLSMLLYKNKPKICYW